MYSWQLTSLELFLMLGFLGLGFFLIISLLKKKQEQLIATQAQQESLKTYQAGNALRNSNWRKGMSSLMTAVLIVLICSSWTFFEGNSSGIAKGLEEIGNSKNEQTIKMIGAISIVQAADAKISSFLPSPTPSKQAGYDNDEDFIKMTSYVYTKPNIPILNCPLAVWDGNLDLEPPVSPIPDIQDRGFEPPISATPLSWGFGIPDLLDNVDEVDLYNRSIKGGGLYDQVGALMPLFPGCDTIVGDDAAKQICSAQKLQNYVYTIVNSNLIEAGVRIPRIGWSVSFRIDGQGKVKDINFSINNKLMAQLLKQELEHINDLGTWTPGTLKGDIRETICTMPINEEYQFSE